MKIFYYKGNVLPIKRSITIPVILIFISFSMMKSIFALQSLESLLLGTYSDEVLLKKEDPISYIFEGETYNESNNENNHSPFKKSLGLYAGFVGEGQNLKNKCERRNSAMKYASTKEHDVAKRSYLATLQYIGLDLVTRYLPHYADFFEFTEEEYINLTDGLVNNYCSRNLTSISLNQLKKNLTFKFKHKEKIELPSVMGNPLFPDRLDRVNGLSEAKRREFAYTIELFKSFCSWGGDIDNYRLMVPFIRHPALAALVMREMSDEQLKWDVAKGVSYIDKNPDTTKVLCHNYICRKATSGKYKRSFPKSIGSSSIHDDLTQMYCSDLKYADYKIKNQVTKISSMIKSMSFSDQNMLTGQMSALITGVPDFILQSKSFADGKNFFRSSVDRIWNEWSGKQLVAYGKTLLYEESLTIEAMDRDLNDVYKKKTVVVDLNFNMGEFDRIGGKSGKVKSYLTFKLSKSYVKWLWSRLSERETDRDLITEKFKDVNESLSIRVNDNLERIEEKLLVAPWKDGVENLVVRNIISQLIHLRNAYDGEIKKDVNVVVNLNYGPFALKYVKHLYDVKRNSSLKKNGRSILAEL
jgi:hypothetical protein